MKTETKLVNAILHRCIDLGWRENRLAKEASIAKSAWSQIRNARVSPRLNTIMKLLDAVGLEIQIVKITKPL